MKVHNFYSSRRQKCKEVTENMSRFLKFVIRMTISLVLLSFLCKFGVAQAPPIEWKRVFSEPRQFAHWVEQLPDGSFRILGTRSTEEWAATSFLVALSAHGATLWEKTFAIVPAFHFKLTTDGGYIVAATVPGETSNVSEALLLKLDGGGNQQWHRAFHIGDGHSPIFVDQQLEGSFILIGTAWWNTQPSRSSIFLICTDNQGNLRWLRTFSGMERAKAMHAQRTSDGGYIVVGNTESAETGWEDVLYVLKVNVTGNRVWEKYFPEVRYHVGPVVGATRDGGACVAAYANYIDGQTSGSLLLRLNSLGDIIWRKSFCYYSEPAYCYSFFSVTETMDGGFMLGGMKIQAWSGESRWASYGCIVRTNAQGEILWEWLSDPTIWNPPQVTYFSTITRLTTDGGVIALMNRLADDGTGVKSLGFDVIKLAPSIGQGSSPIARASDIPDTPKIIYAEGLYTLTAKYFDPDGRSDLKYCYLRLKHPQKPLTMMWVEASGQAWTWAGEEGANYLYNVEASAEPIVDPETGFEGYAIIWTFSIKGTWPQVISGVDLGVCATDDEGNSSGWDYVGLDSAFVLLQPGSGNRPPTAVIRHYPKVAQNLILQGIFQVFGFPPIYPVDSPIVFDASLSWDQDGTIVSYAWDFGDYTRGTGKIVEHKYQTPNVYTVTLFVQDDQGFIAIRSETIFITPPLSTIAWYDNLARLYTQMDALVGRATNERLFKAAEDLAHAGYTFMYELFLNALFEALHDIMLALFPRTWQGKEGIGANSQEQIIKTFAKIAGISITEEFFTKPGFAWLMTKAFEGSEGEPPGRFQRYVDDIRANVVAFTNVLERKIEEIKNSKVAETLDAGTLGALAEDLAKRRRGNAYLVEALSSVAETLRCLGELAIKDGSSWVAKLGETMFSIIISAAATLTQQPLIELLGGLSSGAQALHEAKGWLRYGTMVMAIMAEAEAWLKWMQANVLQGLENVAREEVPAWVDGEIASISGVGGKYKIQVKNTGGEEALFFLFVKREYKFTSYELYAKIGSYYLSLIHI